MRVCKAAFFALALPALVTCIFAQDALQVDAKTIQQHIDHRVFPAYPQIAKAAHVQGTVVFDLRIGTTGKIESMKVVSGPGVVTASRNRLPEAVDLSSIREGWSARGCDGEILHYLCAKRPEQYDCWPRASIVCSRSIFRPGTNGNGPSKERNRRERSG